MLAPLRNPTFHPIILRSLLFITNFSRLPRIYLHYYSLLHHFCVTCIIYCNLMRSLNCLTSWIMSIISSFVYLKKKTFWIDRPKHQILSTLASYNITLCYGDGAHLPCNAGIDYAVIMQQPIVTWQKRMGRGKQS